MRASTFIALASLITFIAGPAHGAPLLPPAHTYSIVAYDAEANQMGVAVQRKQMLGHIQQSPQVADMEPLTKVAMLGSGTKLLSYMKITNFVACVGGKHPVISVKTLRELVLFMPCCVVVQHPLKMQMISDSVW